MGLGSFVSQMLSQGYAGHITAPLRTQASLPSMYRLAKLPNGEMVLQGSYQWFESENNYGFEWKEIPTVNLDEDGNVV